MLKLEPHPVIPDILRQHIEGAAFSWSQRGDMFRDPSLAAEHLGRTDLKIDAHLAAAIASGPEALAEARRRYEDFSESGEAFAWLTPALMTGHGDVEPILNTLAETRTAWPGASGAAAWSGIDALKPYVAGWTKSDDPFRRFLAVTVFSHFRVSPGGQFAALLKDSDTHVRARALRLVGEVGARDHSDAVLDAMDTRDDPALAFWATASALLLGHGPTALPTLRELAEGDGPHSSDALELAVLGDTTPELRKWLGGLIRNPDRRDAALEISGAIADPTVRDWLVSKCHDPEYAAAITQSLRSALPFDIDDTDILESDATVMGDGFAERDDGPWAVADRVRRALDAHGTRPATFTNLPGLRRRALRAALSNPASGLANWRAKQTYPAWS